MALPQTRRPFTTAEYHRMTELGILKPEDRLELIEGEIIQMSAIGPRHAACVDRLAEFLQSKVKRIAIVRVQNPVQLNDYSEPEPDIALVKRRNDFYATEHPQPSDVLIAIEIADSSVEYDREVKLPTYARAGIPEVWLVNLVGDRVEVHTRPKNGIYQEVRNVLRDQRVVSTTIPQLKLKADDILG